MSDKNSISKIDKLFRRLEISNVFLYVGDAVREDYLPREFKTDGTYIRTIASSIHSPASFASIVTGRYPPTHGVTSFKDRLSEDVHRLFDLSEINTQFLNSIFAYATEEHGQEIDPIHSVLDTEPLSVESPFEGVVPPFITMERGPGGHAPYGDYIGTVTEYFEDKDGDNESIQEDYQRSIELDIELFNQRVEELDEKDLLEDTLIIYTSDHGELLGEGGFLGHNDPMRPELVYVPTVFRHPDLPDQQLTETTFHHTDLLPTIITALGRDPDKSKFDGSPPPMAFESGPRPCFWRNQFLPEWVRGVSGELSYEGVWDSSGGRVRTETTRRDRYSVLIGKLIRSSKRSYMWHNLDECISSYWRNSCVFGTPSFDKETAAEILQEAKEDSGSGRKAELSAEEEEHLRNLGYLN